MKLFSSKWPFYVSAVLLSVLAMASLYFFDAVPGIGEGMTGLAEYGDRTLEAGTFDGLPSMNWEFGFIFGIFLGALLAAVVGGKFKIMFFNEDGGDFTDKCQKTIVWGVAGGFLVMTGVQLAGNTVLGQLFEAAQLSGGAWIFLFAAVFCGGVLTLIFGRGGGSSAGGVAKPKRASSGKNQK